MATHARGNTRNTNISPPRCKCSAVGEAEYVLRSNLCSLPPVPHASYLAKHAAQRDLYITSHKEFGCLTKVPCTSKLHINPCTSPSSTNCSPKLWSLDTSWCASADISRESFEEELKKIRFCLYEQCLDRLGTSTLSARSLHNTSRCGWESYCRARERQHCAHQHASLAIQQR